MTLEIVEGLLACLTPVERLTGRTSKLTDQGSEIGLTVGTLNSLLPVKQLCMTHLLQGSGWRDAIGP